MKKDDFCRNVNMDVPQKAIDKKSDQETCHKDFDGVIDAMELPLDQRRELMDRIMQEARDTAIKEAPYNGNLYDDTDEADIVMEKRFQIVIGKMLELKKIYGFPIAKYERETKRAYIEYADGHRRYFDK
jgi:hypothetical protein